MIIIDQITSDAEATSAIILQQRISSQDQVLLIVVGSNVTTVATPSTITVNGVNIPRISAIDNSVVSSEIFYMINPPVGEQTISITNNNGAGEVDAVAYTLSGVDKKTSTPIVATGILGSGTPINTSVQVAAANSLIIDGISSNLVTLTTLNDNQTQTANIAAGSNLFGSSYQYASPGLQNMGWNRAGSGTTKLAQVIVVLEPSSAASMWQPNTNFRQTSDVARSNALDTTAATPLGWAGYNQSPLYLNSFLHTFGKYFNFPDKNPPQSLGANTGSGIIIDNVSTADIFSATNLTVDHTVKSQDVVLIVATVNGNSSTNLQVQYGGMSLTKAVGITNGSNGAQINYLINPPVGNYPIYVDGAGSTSYGITAISLLGVDKKTTNFVTASATGTPGNVTLNITPHSVNSLIIDCLNKPSVTVFPSINQTQISNLVNSGLCVSVEYSQAEQTTISWSGNPQFWAYTAIVLEPANNVSIWHPVDQFRNYTDVTGTNALNVRSSTATGNFGYAPATFYQNSFLHTIGRIGQANAPVGTIISETEQETSQIIIDKVFQGQLASTPVTVNTLNMDISIPSPDAVLVVTGGSVIATGGAWTSVQYNGNSLTKLVQAGVAGQSAEIWYFPYPPVGTGVLSIASASGGEINANAMVLLGVDKRSTNIQVASTTDAASTSTIGALITPDAPNSLIIDTISTLNATTFPVQDSSQTQVFNASALVGSEYVLSTYKIGSGQQNMNYNLSVAVNASLVAVAFRPAQAASVWFPNIDFRELDDTVTIAGLDAEVNPSFGQYGYKPTIFYKNSFLHTVGRMFNGKAGVVVGSSTTLLMLGVG